MIKNMGTIDRIIRIVVAVVIAVLYFTDVIAGTLGLVMLIIAGVFLLTSLIKVCPLYLPFGIKTFKGKKA